MLTGVLLLTKWKDLVKSQMSTVMMKCLKLSLQGAFECNHNSPDTEPASSESSVTSLLVVGGLNLESSSPIERHIPMGDVLEG